MDPGPFQPNIMPVVSKTHYDDRLQRWVVSVSRMITNGDGVKREKTKATFERDDYNNVLTFISRYWGNA